MPGNYFIQVTLGVLAIGFLVAYALSATHHAGRKAERGMSAGLEITQAIISIVVAFGIAFSLGQELPYVQLFEWFHSFMNKRQPCC